MGKLVVSDANIFIDLIAMGFVGDFFQLSFDIMTVDFIMRELKKSGQKGIVQAYEARKKLTIQTFSACEIDEINALRESAGYKVSVQDCSILCKEERSSDSHERQSTYYKSKRRRYRSSWSPVCPGPTCGTKHNTACSGFRKVVRADRRQ